MSQSVGSSEELDGRRSFRPYAADLKAIALLFVIPTLLFADVLFFNNTLYDRDLPAYFYPAKTVIRSIVLGGEFPYWNPYFSAGQPLAANPEFEVFYPPQWLIFLPGYTFWFNAHILLHVYLGLLGMYLLLRSLDLSIPASVFGSGSFGLGGFFLSYINIPPFFFALTWIPFILLFTRRFLLRHRTRDLAAGALSVGMMLLAGEPTTILQAVILIEWMALYLASQRKGSKLRNAMEFTAAAAFVVICGVVIGAVQLVPAFDHLRSSERIRGLSFSVISQWSVPPRRFLELFYPNWMGHLRTYWGSRSYRGNLVAYLFSLYSGMLPPALVVAGIALRRRAAGWVAAILAMSALLAVGDNTPLLRILYQWGVFRTFRYPEKSILLGMIPLFIYSASMFDLLISGDRALRRATVFVVSFLSIAATLFLLFSFSPAYVVWLQHFWDLPNVVSAQIVADISRTDWIVASARGALLLVILLALRAGSGRVWYGLLALFLLYDLGTNANRTVSRVRRESWDAPPIVSKLAPDRASYRIFHEANLQMFLFTRQAVQRDSLSPMRPATWQLRTVLEPDYDLSALLPTSDLAYAVAAMLVRSHRIPEVILAMSNVGYRVELPAGTELDHMDEDPEQAPAVTVTPTARYPRYYFSDQMIRFTGVEDFIARTQGPVSSRVAFVGFGAFQPAAGRVLRAIETANSIDLHVEAEGRAYLVISVTPQKYWHATIDGQPAPLEMTNLAYQGMVVPRGEHQVRLRYGNPLIPIFGSVTLLASAIALAGLFMTGGEAEARSERR
jgi:hypothetical protein